MQDLTNRRFHRLVCQEMVGHNKWNRRLWRCQCDCGSSYVVNENALKKNNTKSCGCLNREKRAERGRTTIQAAIIARTTHRCTRSRLHRIWKGMKTRCYNPRVDNFKNYGGRGVTVCEEWKGDFRSFRQWALINGYRDDLSIERIDNNSGYCPSNCTWATRTDQNRNKRNNLRIEIDGRCLTAHQWSEIYGISPELIGDRILKGWPGRDAVIIPKGTRRAR